MIQCLRMGGNFIFFFLEKSDKRLNIYSNVGKIVIKSICNLKKISDCNIIICDRSGNSMDRTI